MLLLLALAASAGAPQHAIAQGAPPTLPQQLQFDHLGLTEGLANPIVWDILQDHEGFVWFATFDGLQRYDGYRFKTYQHSAANAHSLSSSQLRVLYEDRSGVLWIGSWAGGLNRYDRQTDQFMRYQYDPADPHSLSGNGVRAIVEDRSGNLWVGTDQGLNRLDRASGQFTRYQHDPADPHSLSSNDVFALYEDRAGTLWVSTWGGGLNRLDPHGGRFTRYQHDPADPHSLSTNTLYTAIIEDRAGNLWVSTWAGGLERLDRATGQFTHYRHDPADPHSLSHDTVAALYADAAGELWVGTWGGGLNRLDPSTGRFSAYRPDPLDPYSLSHERVVTIVEDTGGILWIGTEGGGISQLDRYKQGFRVYQHRADDPDGLSAGDVYALAEDQAGELWVGTLGNGLDRLDPQTGRVTHYRNDPSDQTSLSSDMVLAILVDRAGVLWVATDGGLDRYDPRIDGFAHYRNDPQRTDSLSHNTVLSLYEDRAGELWVGTQRGGLNRLDRQTGAFTRYQNDPADPHSLSATPVRAIIEDRAGVLWIGTRGGGLNRFERQTGTFTHYLSRPGDPHSLSSNSIIVLHEDRAGRLWVGTEDGGLAQFEPATQQFVTYQKQDGLPHNSIGMILEDARGDLWLSTFAGLARFDPSTHRVRAYDATDGLRITFGTLNAGVRTRSGTMLFGGIGGFVAFDPAQIVDRPPASAIALTDFQLANRPVAPGRGSLLPQPINQVAALTLSYQERVISFEFSALNYHAPARSRYRYRLEGFDSDWIEVDSTHRFVTYTSLDPGSYILRVASSDGRGDWSPPQRSLAITITPPWWEALWFRLLAVLLGVGIGAAAFNWRMRTIAASTRRLTAQVAERTSALAQRTDELTAANGQLQQEIAERTQAEQAVQQANHMLNRRIGELSALNQIAQTLTVWTSLRAMLDTIGVTMLSLFDAGAISVWRLDAAQASLAQLSYTSPAPARHTSLALADEPLVQRVLAEAQALVIPRHAATLPLALTDGAGGCVMLLPLHVKNTPIGLLVIEAAQPDLVFTPADVALAQTVAGTLVNAIENARLSDEARAAAVEEERRRLARELHDSVSQELFAASLTADVLPQLWQLDPEDGEQALVDIRRLTRSALAEMRTLLVELRPTVLTHAPLHELLDHLITSTSAKSNASVDARLERAPPLPADVQIAVYRIAQEALNNIVKHAQARHFLIELQVSPPLDSGQRWQGTLTVRVADDGRGFAPDQRGNGHLGLGNMRERAESIGAELRLTSQPGHGTILTVTWSGTATHTQE